MLYNWLQSVACLPAFCCCCCCCWVCATAGDRSGSDARPWFKPRVLHGGDGQHQRTCGRSGHWRDTGEAALYCILAM